MTPEAEDPAALTSSDWEDKHILVTGGASGLGAAIARLALSRGAVVSVVDRVEALGAVEHEVKNTKASRRLHPFGCDLADADAAIDMVGTAWALVGPVDVLYNNAGLVGSREPFLELSLADWDEVMGVNLRGAFVVGQSVGRRMSERKSGVIVNTTSQLSTVASPSGQAAYVASKGGLLQLTRAMAVELAPHDVRVNALAPGIVATGINKNVSSDPSWVAERLARVPLGRFGLAEEVAEVALFLGGPRSSYMTGASVVADGGYTIW